MSTGELVNLMFLAFVSAGLGVTFWKRLSEIRDELKGDIAALRAELKGDIEVGRLGTVGLSQDIAGLRQEMGQEIGGLRQEMGQEIGGLRQEIGGLRQEMAIMRSDLTQVALAVGTHPRASND